MLSDRMHYPRMLLAVAPVKIAIAPVNGGIPRHTSHPRATPIDAYGYNTQKRAGTNASNAEALNRYHEILLIHLHTAKFRVVLVRHTATYAGAKPI